MEPRYRYANAKEASIEVVGCPNATVIPVDPKNRDYRKLIASGAMIEPFDPTTSARAVHEARKAAQTEDEKVVEAVQRLGLSAEKAAKLAALLK